MIRIRHKGSFQKTKKFLNHAANPNIQTILERYAKMGVDALSSATPIDSGLTAQSWDYEIRTLKNGFEVVWTNSNVVDGASIALLLQYGHATGNGGYVEGRDYINPALRPVFDQLADNAWKEVTST